MPDDAGRDDVDGSVTARFPWKRPLTYGLKGTREAFRGRPRRTHQV